MPAHGSLQAGSWGHGEGVHGYIADYLTSLIDGPEKARYAAEMASYAASVARATPDDHASRVLARSAFLFLPEFVRVSRQVRNGLRPTKKDKNEVNEIKQMLNDLERRDWGPYKVVRDRVAAHRQPIGGVDDARAWAEANRLWSELDASVVGILVDDAIEIWNALAPYVNQAPLLGLPEIDERDLGELASEGSAGVRIGAGSFDETRRDSISIIQGGDVGERLREVADTIDHFEILVDAYGGLKANLSCRRLLTSAFVIEINGLVELVLEIPAGRSPSHRYQPLVDLVGEKTPEYAPLALARDSIPMREMRQLRDIRNKICAHIDDRVPLRQLLRSLDTLDFGTAQAVWDHVDQALVASANAHPASVVRTLGLRNVQIQGLRRAEPSELEKPY